MKISKDFEEFFGLLNKNKVRYLIGGGYAYAIHTEPRFTKDPDIFVRRTRENARKIMQTLRDFRYGSLDISENDLLNPDQVIRLGDQPYRIDLLTSIS